MRYDDGRFGARFRFGRRAGVAPETFIATVSRQELIAPFRPMPHCVMILRMLCAIASAAARQDVLLSAGCDTKRSATLPAFLLLLANDMLSICHA